MPLVSGWFHVTSIEPEGLWAAQVRKRIRNEPAMQGRSRRTGDGRRRPEGGRRQSEARRPKPRITRKTEDRGRCVRRRRPDDRGQRTEGGRRNPEDGNHGLHGLRKTETGGRKT